MKVLLSGSSGLVGGAMMRALLAAGHGVAPLVRAGRESRGGVMWDPPSNQMDLQSLTGIDAVIHLAGENLSQGRWTAEKKRRIGDSRVGPTQLLARTMAQLRPRPTVFLCASATGYYGDRGEEVLTEDSPAGRGYLAEVCRQWEAACAPAREAGIRVVHLRFGVVLSPAGGALAKMITPFRLGLGGVIGSGRQYVSWIALDDAIAAMVRLLGSSSLSGPVNLVSPRSVTNRELTQSLGRALHRPAVLPLPAIAARLLLGEIADELLLASTRVVPRRLLEEGFAFGYGELDAALAHVLG